MAAMAKNNERTECTRARSDSILVPQWKIWWTRIIQSAELALLVALLSLAFEFGDDQIYLSLFIVCAWLVAAATVATYASLDQTVAAWKISSLTPNRVRSLAGVGFAVIFWTIGLAIHHHAGAHPARASVVLKELPNELFDVQLRELTQVADLIGGQDERHLRQEFQLADIFDHNVMQLAGFASPERETPEQGMEVDRFFAGGNTRFDFRFMRTATATNGGVTIFPVAGKIGAINLSRQNVYAKGLLRYFESSATIPTSVRDAIRQFDATLDKDERLMFDVLNEKYAENPNNLYLNFDRSSGYFHTIDNDYIHRLIPLKPASEEVVASIRAYLKTN